MRVWLDQIANRKVHQTTLESPHTRFQHEQKHLMTSNTKPLFPIHHWEIRKVSKDCFVSYLGKRYSVPFRYVGQELKIKETLDHHLEIYDHYECVAKHPIMTGKVRDHINLEHYKGLQTTTDGLPTHSRLQSPDIEVEQRSLQIYEQLEGGDQS